MKKSINKQIEELYAVSSRMSELKNTINSCEEAIKLVNRTYGRTVVGEPHISVVVTDRDKWDNDDIVAKLDFSDLTSEEAQIFTTLINNMKKESMMELESLEKQYGEAF